MNLFYLYLPFPCGGGGARVNVDVDRVALVGGGDKHVLAGVVSADDRGGPAPGVGDGHGVANVDVHLADDEIMHTHDREVDLVRFIIVFELDVASELLVDPHACRLDFHV